jgi:hypothetical protein
VDCTKPDRSELDHAEPNQALFHQIIMHNKGQNRAQLNLTDTILFFGTLSIILLFKEALFPFSDEEAPNLVDTLDQIILSHWVPHKQ